MAFPSDLVRSRTPNSRLRDHIRPPVVYGALLQAAAMIGFVAFGSEMSPVVFVVGMIGPVLAALLTAPDAGWVDAPLAGLAGGCLYLLAFLLYGVRVAIDYPYVEATWVFGSFVSTALSQAIMLLPAFVFFGVLVGGAVGFGKSSLRRL